MIRPTIQSRLSCVRMSSEDGFTLIEVLVAAVVMVIGVLALLASFDQSRGLASQSESQVAATAVAERQLDAGVALTYNKLALAQAAPLAGGSALDVKWNNVLNYGTESAGSTLSPIVPNPSGLVNDCAAIAAAGYVGYGETRPNNERKCIVSCPPAVANPLVPATPGNACPGVLGVVTPYSQVSDAAGVRYEIYRYVTWVNDIPCGLLCPNPGLPKTAGDLPGPNPAMGDYKRLTVAVQVLGRGTGTGATLNYTGLKQAVVVSAVKIDPTRATGNTQNEISPLLQGATG